MKRILESPVLGVGGADIETYARSASRPETPHNTFLFFALSGGIVPTALLMAFFIQAARRSAFCERKREQDSFRLPYLVFTFVVVMVGDLGFMAPWGLLTVSLAAGLPVIYAKQRLVAIHRANRVPTG